MEQATVPTPEGTVTQVEGVIPGTVNLPSNIVPTSQGENYPTAQVVEVGEQDQSGIIREMDNNRE